MLVPIIEKCNVFNKNTITIKLSKNPANESANLTAFPNSMPMIMSLIMFKNNVHFVSKICREIRVMILASPILTPRYPTFNGNKISIYDNISEILNRMTEYGKIYLFCNLFLNILFDIF